MNEMLISFISSFISITNTIYVWCKISKNKVNFLNPKFWLLFIITLILAILNYRFVDNTLKVVNITIILIVIYKLLFKTSLKDSIVIPVIVEFSYIIFESLYVMLILFLINGNVDSFMNNFFNSLFSNFTISFMVFIFSESGLFSKLVDKLNSKISKIEEPIILFLILLCIMIYNVLTVKIYYQINPIVMMVISVLVSAVSLILVYLFFKAKNDYYKINEKYDSSLSSLNELEKVLSNYRIDNHENKNHLLTIKSMTKNKKVIDFIDSILDSKLKDSSRIMHETGIIPAGGLRGLIYSKLLVMDSKNIEYELEVEKSIRIVNLLDYGNDTMLDICKIVGIFLDNAIEEIDNYDDKYIIIEMYKKDDVIVISVTNPINHSIDSNNIYDAGISTKGGNHGYGLSLVKKLVKENSKLKTYPEVSDEEFTQILEIYR